MRPELWMLLFLLAVPGRAGAQGVAMVSESGAVRLDLGGMLDLEGYQVSDPPPGLVFGSGGAFFNPRLMLFGDVKLGAHVYGFVQVRADRGFDPRSRDSDLRVDEYLLRYSPFQAPTVNLQIGKSATVVGNWVGRHYSWDNPFVTAPLPYENVTIIWDRWAPPDPATFLGYLQQPDRKADMLPVIWGPGYTTGLTAFGALGRWDYGVEVKNAGLSSRPSDWGPGTIGWRRPTVSGRVGYRPSPAWNLGVSASRGHYMAADPDGTLAPGASLEDFHQVTLAHDLSYAHGRLQLWAEVFVARFEVQEVGRVGTVAYYAEAKYKLTPQVFLAFRWNQQFFGEDVVGQPWDGQAARAEVALGYRFSRRIQGKLHYGALSEDRPVAQGRHLAAAQVTMRF